MRATQALSEGHIHALVTAPINKQNIQSENFAFAGHTEYLGAKLGGDPLMILCSETGLRVALVTGHVPLRDVPAALSQELISKKITQLHNSLVRDFAVRKPRIAVLGLNPHAGDSGLIGSEEGDLIRPAIEKTKTNGLIYGPYAADGFFGNGTWRQFDAVLAMYHDQGLIPFKTIAFGRGVNFTAGLPIVRTSPDHGTAYDIAGKDKASEDSFREALFLALNVIRHRKNYAEMHGNPLKKAELSRETT
mgnify:CR=1 FL=1